MPQDKILKALKKVTDALKPLDPESRRRTLEAVHAVLEIGRGQQGGGQGGRGGQGGPEKRHK